MNELEIKVLENWLKEYRTTSLRNSMLFMSYIDNEKVFILYSAKDKVILKSPDFKEVYNKLMGKR